MREIGLDVHRDFCEVAISEAGELRSAPRIKTTPTELELFARSLGREDRVALEVSGNAWSVARVIEPHVARVLVVSPNETGIRQARAKTDRLDARALARLLAAGSLEGLWMPDAPTRALRRRLQRRSQLVRARTRAKNEIHAALMRQLIAKPKVSDLFGQGGRRWLEALELPICERETLDTALRQIDFLDREVAEADRVIAADALGSVEIRRLMSVPGVNVIAAATFIAAVGEIGRFPDPRRLVGYLGLDPQVRQLGSERGFYRRLRARRGAQAAIVAVARKLARLFWCLLTREEDYAYAQPSLTRKKLRRLELRAGAPKGKVERGAWSTNAAMRRAERELARQGEVAYERTVADWKRQQRARRGAGATPGRASHRPSN